MTGTIAMTAKEQLRQRLAKTPDPDLTKLEALMEDALPRALRTAGTLRLTEAVRTRSVRLRQEIDDLTEDEAQEIAEYLDWAAGETDTASDEEIEDALKGQAEIARGDYVTLEELRRRLGS